jgi:hypothetical protein
VRGYHAWACLWVSAYDARGHPVQEISRKNMTVEWVASLPGEGALVIDTTITRACDNFNYYGNVPDVVREKDGVYPLQINWRSAAGRPIRGRDGTYTFLVRLTVVDPKLGGLYGQALVTLGPGPRL